MDTLFRLVSLQSGTTDHQQSSFNSTISSRSNNSSSYSKHNHSHTINNNHAHRYTNHQSSTEEEEEECFNFFMDDNQEDFSTTSNNSSSKHHHHHQHHQPHHSDDHRRSWPSLSSVAGSAPDSGYYPSFSPPENHQIPAAVPPSLGGIEFSGRWWAAEVLEEAARAVADKNTARVQQLLWILNELGTPYGDTEQKLAAYFLQALFSRLNDSGERCHRTLAAASDRACSFDSTRRTLLKFQEVSPWTTFGHVACNGAILEALDGEAKLHIVDVSNTYCTQWPTLLEALATRSDDTPHLRLTSVVSSAAAAHRVMREIGARMEKFARLMGVPFEFAAIHHSGDLSDLDPADLALREDEALAINMINSLHSVSVAGDRRSRFLRSIRSLGPRIVTVVEEEADLNFGSDGESFVAGLRECVRWFRVYFEAIDESFPRTSNERLIIERAAGRAVVDLVALSPEDSTERRETAERWGRRIRSAGFSPAAFSEEVCDDVKALLRRYKEGWAMAAPAQDSVAGGVLLTWKDQAVVWASAWRP